MRTFTDNADRKWELAVTVASIERVRGDCEVDLYEMGGGGETEPLEKLAFRLLADPILLCRVIWSLIRPQAERLGVEPIDFGEAMAGDAIERATEALLAEIVDFTPSPRVRQRMGRALGLVDKILDQGQDALDERMPETEREVEAALTQLAASSGSLPESPASTPAP